MYSDKSECDHVGHRRYVRRAFANGSIHVCVQCQRCKDTVRMPEHGFKPYIRLDEVPPDRAIGEWIEKHQKSIQLEIDK